MLGMYGLANCSGRQVAVGARPETRGGKVAWRFFDEVCRENFEHCRARKTLVAHKPFRIKVRRTSRDCASPNGPLSGGVSRRLGLWHLPPTIIYPRPRPRAQKFHQVCGIIRKKRSVARRARRGRPGSARPLEGPGGPGRRRVNEWAGTPVRPQVSPIQLQLLGRSVEGRPRKPHDARRPFFHASTRRPRRREPSAAGRAPERSGAGPRRGRCRGGRRRRLSSVAARGVEGESAGAPGPTNTLRPDPAVHR